MPKKQPRTIRPTYIVPTPKPANNHIERREALCAPITELRRSLCEGDVVHARHMDKSLVAHVVTTPEGLALDLPETLVPIGNAQIVGFVVTTSDMFRV
jgi:hypothetical protein